MQVENKPSDKDKNVILVEDMFPVEHLQSIKDIIVDEGYIKYQVSKTKIFNTNSFLGKLYEVSIKGKTANGRKETNIFVKISVPDINNKIVSISEMYYKECYFYKELSDILTTLQDEARVPAEERFIMAKSYKATNLKAMFLENLTAKDFETLHSSDIMPLKFAELAVQHLAKLHGLFYIIQRKMPEYFDRNLKVLKPSQTLNDEWNEFVLHSSKFSISALAGEAKKKVEDCILQYLKKYESYMLDTSSIGSTICHGDYRVSNFLVKYTNGILTDVVPVDYQMLHYGNPLKDLIYFIFGGSDQDFRNNHLNDLKNLYYDHLKQFLDYFDLDVNEIYSREEFEKLFKNTLEYGCICWLFFMPYLFLKENDKCNSNEIDVMKVDFSLDSQFSDRVQGLVDDFIKWGYL